MEKRNDQIDGFLQKIGEFWKNKDMQDLEFSNLLRILSNGEVNINNIDENIMLKQLKLGASNYKEYKIDAEDTGEVLIRPNFVHYCGDTLYPILFEITDYDEFGNSSCAGLSIKNAKDIITALQEIVDLVEKRE